MQLPNKLYSYKNSTLALIPAVLNEIKMARFLLVIYTGVLGQLLMMQQILSLLWIVCMR